MEISEIQKRMLQDYESLIDDFIKDRIRLEGQHEKIRKIELDLKTYFDIDKTYHFWKIIIMPALWRSGVRDSGSKTEKTR